MKSRCRPSQQRALWDALLEHGAPLGMKPIGMRAQDSLRLEKGYGVWSLEFAQSYTPAMSGLDRFIAFDKGEFIGRDAALAERAAGPSQRLVLLAIDATDADVTGFEPVWAELARVGFVTSGAYGHHVKQSLALAYRRSLRSPRSPCRSRCTWSASAGTARILAEPPYDPQGLKLRG